MLVGSVFAFLAAGLASASVLVPRTSFTCTNHALCCGPYVAQATGDIVAINCQGGSTDHTNSCTGNKVALCCSTEVSLLQVGLGCQAAHLDPPFPFPGHSNFSIHGYTAAGADLGYMVLGSGSSPGEIIGFTTAAASTTFQTSISDPFSIQSGDGRFLFFPFIPTTGPLAFTTMNWGSDPGDTPGEAEKTVWSQTGAPSTSSAGGAMYPLTAQYIDSSGTANNATFYVTDPSVFGPVRFINVADSDAQQEYLTAHSEFQVLLYAEAPSA